MGYIWNTAAKKKKRKKKNRHIKSGKNATTQRKREIGQILEHKKTNK